MTKNVFKALFILFLTLFVIVGGMMGYKYVTRQAAENILNEIVEDTQSAESASTSDLQKEKTDSIADSITSETVSEKTEPVDILAERGITIPEKNINWTELQNENPDIYSWIYIPGTNIDYPILQHPEDKSYYLDHNIDGSEGYPGCIYTQNVNTKDWTDPQTVIFGHNMNNGSMFHDLHRFEDGVFFDETQYLYIYTPEKTLVYEIFASYPFSDVDLMMCFDYSTPDALLAYFDGIWTNRGMTSHFRNSVILYGDSRIITMSTCIGGQPDMRYLVQAVYLDEVTASETE